MPTTPHIVIVGGGTAGITVAARLRKALPAAHLTLVEPSSKHYYQPLWTLVGAGEFPREVTEREEASVMPRGVDWRRDAAATFEPEQNTVVTRAGERITYDYLVVAAGIQLNWGDVKGLKESIGHNGVCSNYAYEYVNSTWETLRNFKGGNALFTAPNTPVKCGGAPQKIMYMAEDYMRRHGMRDKANVMFTAAGTTIFAIAKYRETLERIVRERHIELRLHHNLIEIRGDRKEAVFERLDTHEFVTIPYEMIHVTPPMGAPDFIKQSPLADKAGWVDVNKDTMQHVRYPNVFALGDASNLPTSRTGAAIRKQAPVLVRNLIALINGRPLTGVYNGYTSCPIVTRHGRMMLAEFDYNNEPHETFPFDQSKERWSMWLLKKYGLPLIYWHGMLKGRL